MSKLIKKYIGDDQVGASKILLENNSYFRGKNQANNANVNILRVNTSNVIEFASVPVVTSDAVSPNELVRLSQIQNFLEGISPKEAVRAATTANITLSGTQTIDDIALVAGNRVLVKDQSVASQNGIYTVSAGVWLRTADADAAEEIEKAYVAVSEGTVNGGKVFAQSGTVTVLGVDPVNFVFFNATASLIGGDGVTITGSTINVDLKASGGLGFDSGQLQVIASGFAGEGLEDDGSGNLRVASTVAGDGLSGGSGIALFVQPDITGGANLATVINVNSNGISVNIDDITIGNSGANQLEVKDNSINEVKLTSSVAGGGLTGGNGTPLSVVVDDVTIETVLNTLRVKDASIGASKLIDDSVNALKINPDVAGNGLVQAIGGALEVNVDNSTIVINADTLEVADGGITEAKLNADIDAQSFVATHSAVNYTPDQVGTEGADKISAHLKGIDAKLLAITSTITPGGHTHVKADITDFNDADYASAVHTHVLADITDAGTAAARNVPTIGDAIAAEVVLGNDSRLTNARTPLTHTHVLADVIDSGVLAGLNTINSSTLIDNSIVTNAKLSDIGQNLIKGRKSTGVGVVEDLTASQVRAILNVAEGANNYTHPPHSGDVTSIGDGATTIVTGAVTNLKLSTVPALTLKGNDAGTTGVVQDLSVVEVKAMLGYVSTSEIDTLAELNSIVTDATLDDSSNPRTPTSHASTHILGGSDIIDGTNINFTYTPSNYTPDTVSNAVNSLVSHIEGIDNTLTSLGVSDHGALTGLLDDDHTIYHTDARGDARYVRYDAVTSLSVPQQLQARNNIGLGTMATETASDYLTVANNLSDLNDSATARTNLGLGTSSVLNVPATGNAATGEVVKGDDTRLTDSRTPTVHGAAHITGGSDEIDGDQLDIDFTPTYYTPTTSPAEVTNLDHLSAHLAGIDVQLNTISSGTVSSTRAINTQNSLTGGGDLSADRTLELVNDVTSPGNNQFYGTSALGVKGWQDGETFFRIKSIVNHTGTTYTITSADANDYLRLNNASAITVTLNTGTGLVAGDVITLYQLGLGTITVSGTATINGIASTTRQFENIQLVCVTTDTFDVN